MFQGSQQNQKSTIRIVDLQGKPHNVKMRTPELNLQAIAKQGNSYDKEKEFRQTNASENPNFTRNKYANNSNDFGYQNQTNQLKENVQAPEYSDQNGFDKTIIGAGKSEQNKEKIVEYSLLKNNDNNSENNKDNAAEYISPKGQIGKNEKSISSKNVAILTGPTPPKAIKTNIKNEENNVKNGIFVQTGSFAILSNAKQSLESVKLISRPSKAMIETSYSDDKEVYKVLIGPFSSKQKASLMINKLSKANIKSIIVKK